MPAGAAVHRPPAGMAGGKRWHRGLRPLLIVSLVLLVGCAGSSWSYRFAGWYLSWQLRDFIALEGAQRADLDQRLDTLLRWHQGTQLPRYSAWLQQLQSMLQETEPVSAGQWRAQGEQLGEFWADLMQRVLPHATAVLADLSDAQVEELLHRLAQHTDEQGERELAVDSAKRRRQWAVQMRKSIERWTGPLRAEQYALVKGWSTALQEVGESAVESRRHWNEELAAALAERQHAEKLERHLGQLLVYPARLWSADYAAAMEYNAEQTLMLFTTLHESLDHRQQQTLHTAIQRWSDRLQRLGNAAR